ncbi:MAG TPA: polysaccharide lyase family protein, partial [Tepidisphaeraceae bacterium]|nr:polysaccharide lyase family protein [Tepidisphaeraceae bacterium]
MTVGCAAPRTESAPVTSTQPTTAPSTQPSAVTVSDDGETYTLSNGIVTARILKHSGAMASLVYQNIETLAGNLGRPTGNWSHSAASDVVIDAITIDPKANSGQRGEVSIKGVSNGHPMGQGPGGSMVADIEIRYALDRGSSGIYTYCTFTHQPYYPAMSVGEARFYVKLNDDVYDWMTVDANRNMKMITASDWNHGTQMNMKEARLMNTGIDKGQVEHKYDYSANQFDVTAWGWSSTTRHVGFWFINPSVEYLSGGPTKMELSAHRDATFNLGPEYFDAPAAPCLLNYWRSSHYGGSVLSVAVNERWEKVVGPFLIYCNAGASPDAMWKDALARSKKESAAWPYNWVNGVDYPHADLRGDVKGQLALNDPQAKSAKLPNLLVGLTAPDYTVNGRFGQMTVDWQTDAKHYEFWTRGDADGKFLMLNVRPGTYTLHAIADGVLGDFARANVTVLPDQGLDLGKIEWRPVRHGRQLWDIGIPNRSAKEFRHGDDYWHWGLYLQYPKEFPNDVNYTIGQSDFHKDWNYCQVPRATDALGKSQGTATTWTVHFNLPDAPPPGKAILRLAFCGSSNTTVSVTVNGKPAGDTGRLPYNATINRDAVQGNWFERDVTFDTSLMHAGENDLKLSIPAGGVTSGVEYDYVRLELADGPATTQK